MVINNINQSRTCCFKLSFLISSFEVVSYYFETDLNFTKQRNSYLEGHADIPDMDVRAIYKKLEVPSLDEGFDQIFKVKIVGNGEFDIRKY